MSDQPLSHFDRFLKPILASRFLTVSALIHLLIILLVGGRVLFNKYVEPPDFQGTPDPGVSSDVSPQAPDTPNSSLPPAPSVAAPPPPTAPAASLTAIASLNTSNAAFSMPVPEIAPPTLGNTFSTATAAAQPGAGPASALPSVMGGRSAGGRAGAGARYGAVPAADLAVLRALRWLQAQQLGDGTWGTKQYHDAFTGLAILCYLGHGETPESSHEFGLVVSKAIQALVTEANAHESQFGENNNFGARNSVYQHAICTYALSEAYAMTKDERLAPIIKQAVQYIIKSQLPDGGWVYSYDTSPGDSDTSVTGWQIQALKAAHLTGIPGIEQQVHPVLDKSMRDMDRVFNPQYGTFGYHKADDKTNHLTGVGVLSKLIWTGRPDAETRAGIKSIESEELVYTGPDCNLYGWYYDTQACFQAQGSAWDWWKQRFQDQLIPNQSPDGSWPLTGGKETGDDINKPDGDSSLYRTTLCCLMLEVFYRYAPTSQASGLSGGLDGL